MILDIPKEESYLCPEGIFPAVIADVRPCSKKWNGQVKDFVRITWTVQCGGGDQIEYKAGKNYTPSLAPGSALREDLLALGIKLPPGQQIDLRQLKGLHCDLQISHTDNEGYDLPLVVVRRVAPLGALGGE